MDLPSGLAVAFGAVVFGPLFKRLKSQEWWEQHYAKKEAKKKAKILKRLIATSRKQSAL